MATEEIHVGDIGTAFRVALLDGETPVDVSGATALTIFLKKPDSTVLTKTAAFYTDGSDGIIQYVSVEDDLDLAGTWRIQARATLPTGTWSSSTGRFKVYANLT